MTRKEAASCINTIVILKNLCYRVRGLMDVIDAQNCDKIIEMLNTVGETHKKHTETHACDTISRQGALDGLSKLRPRMIDTYEKDGDTFLKVRTCDVNDMLEGLPSAQPERKISNKEWIDFLVFQFDISRTSAKEMLHGMMRWKKEDNFKKQFRGEQDG